MATLLFYPLWTKAKTQFPIYRSCSSSTRFVQPNKLDHNDLTKPAAISQFAFSVELPETLKVIAIRIQFQRDNDRGTTGTGWFDLTDTDSAMINPPPHDYGYFANQLKAMKDYFQKVSHGNLILDITDKKGNFSVYPQQPDSVWTLSQPMSHYNPNTSEEELDLRLAELFREAIQIADQSSSINFAEFDVYIVFHAGVGSEFSQDFDTTPHDIPSVFLSQNDLKNAFGNSDPDYQGIAVNEGNFFVPEGIILPETENQSGNEFGVLGTAVFMLGHQLGLPNLFDTDSGHPGIGRFGIMDQGSGSFSGLIPVQPCAWSKIFLGWEKPIMVTAGERLPVAASLASHPNKIYKIPINAKEYYLIENRNRTVLKNREVAIGRDANGSRIEFTDDGELILAPGQSKIGVIVEIDEYDFGLPGSGILIWHIDENVIEAHYLENRVNADMNHRGVDLVEADGAQDIGYFFNFFGITGYEAGSAYDMWWDENEDFKYANSSETVSFTPSTMPASLSHSGANTGIYVTNFSQPDSVMYFTLEVKNYQTGFPVFLGQHSGSSPVVCGDLNGDGQRELVASTEAGKILAWKANGEKYFSNQDQTFRIDFKGDTTFMPLAVFAQIENDRFTLPPSLADLTGDGKLEVITASDNGRLLIWKADDDDQNGYADLLSELNLLQAKFSTVPVIGNFMKDQPNKQIAIGAKSGQLFILSESSGHGWSEATIKIFTFPFSICGLVGYGDIMSKGLIVAADDGTVLYLEECEKEKWKRNFSASNRFCYPVVADLNRDENLEIVLTSAAGNVFILDKNGDKLEGFQAISLGIQLSHPAIADIDANGYSDIVLVGRGKIFAFNYQGTLLTNFPMLFEQGEDTVRYPDPVIADIDNDGFPEIFVSSKENKLLAFDRLGKKNNGFPLSVSGSPVVNLGITDLSGSGKFNLFARSADDYGYNWQLDFAYSNEQVYWGEYLLNAQHNAIYLKENAKPAKQGDLMPVRSVYNYPNPTEGNSTTIRYFLRDQAQVTIKIYDMAGELVDELKGTGSAEIDNEVMWNISKVQSGVYLAQVKAVAKDETNSVIIKIAVIK